MDRVKSSSIKKMFHRLSSHGTHQSTSADESRTTPAPATTPAPPTTTFVEENHLYDDSDDERIPPPPPPISVVKAIKRAKPLAEERAHSSGDLLRSPAPRLSRSSQQSSERRRPRGERFKSALLSSEARPRRQTATASILAHFLTRDTHESNEFNVAGAVCPPRAGKLFEYFLVVGAELEAARHVRKPSLRPHALAPTVLYRYPRSAPSSEMEAILEQVPRFCFAGGVDGGVDVRALAAGGSFSRQHEVMFGALARLEKIGPSFVFLLSGGDTLLYGVCVIKPEFVEAIPSLIAGATARPFDETQQALTSRCYCFLTRFPFFHLHFEVMYAVLARERLNALELMGAGAAGDGGSASNTSVATEEILREYHEHPVPQTGASSTFEIRATLHQVQFFCPPGAEDKLIGKWSLPPCVSLLSLNNIVTLLTAVMLERRVIFVSELAGRVSACVLAVIPLFRPWIWQGTYVPLLPPHLRECLQAPVPFLMGVPGSVSPRELAELDPTCVVVWVDEDRVALADGSDAARSMPALPHRDVLHRTLQPLYERLRAPAAKKTCGKISPDAADAVSAFTRQLTIYHHWLFASIRKGIRSHRSSRSTSAVASRRSSRDSDDSPPPAARPPLPPKEPRVLQSTTSGSGKRLHRTQRHECLRADSNSDNNGSGSSHHNGASPPHSDEGGERRTRASSAPRQAPPAVPSSSSPGAYDFATVEDDLDELLGFFQAKHQDFLRTFLLTQHVHFYATRVASSTEKLTLIDHQLDELGAMLRRSSARALDTAPPPLPHHASLACADEARRRHTQRQRTRSSNADTLDDLLALGSERQGSDPSIDVRPRIVLDTASQRDSSTASPTFDDDDDGDGRELAALDL